MLSNLQLSADHKHIDILDSLCSAVLKARTNQINGHLLPFIKEYFKAKLMICITTSQLKLFVIVSGDNIVTGIVLWKKDVLKNIVIFIGKHLFWSLFLIKLQAFKPATLIKRNSNTGVFLWIFQTLKEQLFWRTPSVAAPVISWVNKMW